MKGDEKDIGLADLPGEVFPVGRIDGERPDTHAFESAEHSTAGTERNAPLGRKAAAHYADLDLFE
jgi:hypothetical protein